MVNKYGKTGFDLDRELSNKYPLDELIWAWAGKLMVDVCSRDRLPLGSVGVLMTVQIKELICEECMNCMRTGHDGTSITAIKEPSDKFAFQMALTDYDQGDTIVLATAVFLTRDAKPEVTGIGSYFQLYSAKGDVTKRKFSGVRERIRRDFISKCGFEYPMAVGFSMPPVLPGSGGKPNLKLVT